VKGRTPPLVAVDSASTAALVLAARAALAAMDRRRRSGISHWDASGLFEEVAIADDHAGRPSARTLLLLYAADLAFRVRWEIRPALAAGRGVVAAPYIDTAIAFGRAVGLRGGWLKNLFSFAPVPTDRRFVEPLQPSIASNSAGFVEFGRDRVVAAITQLTGQEVVERTIAHLRAAARRSGSKIVKV